MHPLFRGVSVIPVVTVEHERDAVPLARALAEGGLRIIEVALRKPAAISAIAAIARELPQVAVGAGTLTRPADVAAAVHAGARFLVSPGTIPELAAAALAAELPYLPGVATPSEVMAARALGICVMKLFPAEALGGIAMLRALAPVFPGIAFCPTGGVGEHNVADYLALPTSRWSAARGWRRPRRSLPAIGAPSGVSPSAPPPSAAPRRLRKTAAAIGKREHLGVPAVYLWSAIHRRTTMDSYGYGAKSATIAAAAILLALSALPARAQAPGGSYLQTCTHVRSNGDRVTADCRQVDGRWNRTELQGAEGCVGGIANTNGQLTCNTGRRDYGEMRHQRGSGSERWDQGYGSSRRYDRDYNGR